MNMNLQELPVSIQTFSITVPNVSIFWTILHQVHALIAEQRKYQIAGYTEMNGFYELKTNERGILSLTLSNYAYTYPMAHGMTLLKSLTIDVNTGKTYDLKELFTNSKAFVRTKISISRTRGAIGDYAPVTVILFRQNFPYRWAVFRQGILRFRRYGLAHQV
ncbi:hypothetical protein BSNK01_26130 [Bacillaceae bacterium]